MGFKSRTIPGVTLQGVTRGGGMEQIQWASNGPMLLQRSYTRFSYGVAFPTLFPGSFCFVASMPLSTGSAKTDSVVKSDGALAIGRSIPASPSVSLLTSAGELTKDGLPSPLDLLRWRRTLFDILQKGANTYVQYEFAYKPLLAEIQAWAKQVQNFDANYANARRLSTTKRIKVGYSFPPEEFHYREGGTLTSRLWSSGSSTGDISPRAALQERTSRVWFEAEYLNFLPSSRGSVSRSQDAALRARQLLGVGLGPKDLWELAPWSWAVDWVANVDDILSSVTNTLSDGMVMRNGFVMHHFRNYSENVATNNFVYNVNPKIQVFSPARTIQLSETKKRFSAIPYFGFGPSAQLSAKQISILAALGIARA